MSRKVIYFLSLTMAIAVVALIWLQTMAIKRTSQLKEEHFNLLVNRALEDVVEKLENEEMNLFLFGEDNTTTPGGSTGFFPNSDAAKPLNERVARGELSLSFNMNGSNYRSGMKTETKISFGDSNQVHVQHRSMGSIEFLGSNQPNGSMMQNKFQQSSARQERLIRSMEFNLNRSSIPVNKRIDPDYLKHLLNMELRNSGITLDYQYAVESQISGKSTVLMGSDGFDPDVTTRYRKLLFQNDINVKPNFLTVYFPEQRGFLIQSTGFLVIPSILLTFIIIGIFALTLHIILRQKKLSLIKNDFINNMTHELKTPISTISLASQMLKDTSVAHTPKTIEHVSGVIFDESKRLSYQVEKVLQMAVFNEGRLKLKMSEINLNDVAGTVASNFQIRVTSQHGELNTRFAANHPLIKGDEVHITNVLFNLLDNAVKYSTEKPEIEFSTENKNGWVVVAVKDNGIGIPKEHQKQIFERFYRVPTGNVHNVKGFGLGLSYVKRIIDAHNGQIKVDSSPGKGTRFRIYLPVKVQ